MDAANNQTKRAKRSIFCAKVSGILCVLGPIFALLVAFLEKVFDIQPFMAPYPLEVLRYWTLLMLLGIPVVSFVGAAVGIIDVIKGPERLPPFIGILLNVILIAVIFWFVLWLFILAGHAWHPWPEHEGT